MCQILLINTLPSYKKHHTIIKEGGIALFIAKINLRFCLMLIVSPFISALQDRKILTCSRPDSYFWFMRVRELLLVLRRNNEAREHRYR